MQADIFQITIGDVDYDCDAPRLAARLTVTVTARRMTDGELTTLHSDRILLDKAGQRERFAASAGTNPDDLIVVRDRLLDHLTAQRSSPAEPEEEAEVADSGPEDGAQLLDEVAAFIARFVAYPHPHAVIAHTLWIAHAHLMDAWDSTPRLAFLSPEPGSGKTRALEVTEPLVPRPVEAVNVSASYLFRKVDDAAGRPTILFDEIDTVFGPKAGGDEDLRALLNAGHRKGAVAGRCVVREKQVETVEFPAYAAVAIAGLGDLPDTILTRSVVVRMRRRKSTERVSPWRRREELPAAEALYSRLVNWTKQIRNDVTAAWPEMPAGIEDRNADVWEALIACADAAGGDWPERARTAATALVAAAQETAPSLGIRLLADLRTVFGDRDGMSTDAILTALAALDEAPWGELVAGKPLNARGLAKRLLAYGARSANVRIGDSVRKGYRREDLADAWARYLSTDGDPSPGSATAATAATPQENPRYDATSPEAHVADLWVDVADSDLADRETATENPRQDANVADVADVADLGRGSAKVAPAAAGQTCVECDAPIPQDQFYCARHGGASFEDAANLERMARELLTFTSTELDQYRTELAGVTDEPDIDQLWTALAVADLMRLNAWRGTPAQWREVTHAAVA